jgi:hypothetical protein
MPRKKYDPFIRGTTRGPLGTNRSSASTSEILCTPKNKAESSRWPSARVEDTDAAQRQKKRRHPHLAQSLAQPILRRRFHVAQKGERQMKLFLGKPAQAAQMRIERPQRFLATRRKFETNEESFRQEHP